MQTINMNSELVCRYVKLYDDMCKCKNINVNFIAKYAKYNVLLPIIFIDGTLMSAFTAK